MMNICKGWIGVDLDKTLAFYDVWRGIDHIGEPVPKMVERIKGWVEEGREVRIFTARVHDNNPDIIKAIENWCLLNLGFILPITNKKDFDMVELWDDLAVGVIANTGEIKTKEDVLDPLNNLLELLVKKVTESADKGVISRKTAELLLNCVKEVEERS